MSSSPSSAEVRPDSPPAPPASAADAAQPSTRISAREHFRKNRRQPELDALRGLLLFWMTLTHLPTPVSAWANQPFGFVSAAEGFVFLSALLTGKIYASQAAAGFSTLRAGLWPRALRVYAYHLLLIAFAFTIGSLLAPTLHRPMLHNLLSFYFAHPVAAAVSSIFLIYCPPLLDILPMYVLFLLITPLLFVAARRFSWSLVLSISALIWLAAQFGFRVYFYAAISRLIGHHIPVGEMGAFDLFAWQFLWCAGIWLGTIIARPSANSASAPASAPVSPSASATAPTTRSFPTAVTVLATVIVVACACLRRSWPTPIFWTGSLAILQDKWRFAPLRILDFTAIGIVLWRFRPAIKRVLNLPPLPAVGMSSLQVFSAHVVFVFCALALITQGSSELLHGWLAAAVIAVTLTGMLLTGILASANKLRTPKPPPPQPSPDLSRDKPPRPPAPSPI
jgi:hypothetical protein